MNISNISSIDKNTTSQKKSSIAIFSWFVWGLVATFFFYKYLLQVSPSVMSADLMRSFSITGAGLGNLAACFFYSYLLMQIPVGLLLDRYSVRLVTTLAIFVCSTGTLLFSFSQSLLTASLARSMIGLGAAFAAVSCFKCVAIWFPPNRFALVAGLSMTAAMLGAVGGEAPLALLVNSFGWRHAMLYMALPGFLLMLLIFIFMRDNAPYKEKEAKAQTIQSLTKELLTIVKQKQTWFLSLYSGLAFAPISIFGGLWGVAFLEQAYSMNSVKAASAVSLIFVGFAIGCPISGWLSDFIERRKIIMLMGTLIALVSITAIVYFPLQSTLTLNFFLLALGLGGSCFFLCFSMIREINLPIFAATVIGFMNTFDSICEAVSEPFIGKLLDLRWSGDMLKGARIFSLQSYHFALFTLVIYFLLALILLCFIRETYCKQTR